MKERGVLLRQPALPCGRPCCPAAHLFVVPLGCPLRVMFPDAWLDRLGNPASSSSQQHSQDELGSPALAFVRTACHLLALDATVSDEVALLRRRLLKLLGVGEFGSAAQFREPCMSFRLPDVICGWVRACGARYCMRVLSAGACALRAPVWVGMHGHGQSVGLTTNLEVMAPRALFPLTLFHAPHKPNLALPPTDGPATPQLLQRLPGPRHLPRPRAAGRPALGLRHVRAALRHGGHRGAAGEAAGGAREGVRAAGPAVRQVQAGGGG